MSNFFDELNIFDFLGVEEEKKEPKKEPVKKSVTVTAPAKTSEKKASEKTLQVEKVKRIRMLNKKYDLKKGDIEKKSAKVSEFIRLFADKVGYPKPEALEGTFDYAGGTLYVALKSSGCLAKDAQLPDSFVGYTFLGKEQEYRLYDAYTVEGIRNALDVSDADCKDEQYGFLALSDDCVVPVLVPKPFAVPFAEKLKVLVDGEEVELSFTKKEEKKPAPEKDDGDVDEIEEDDAEEGAEEESDAETFTELNSEEIALALAKQIGNSYVNVAKLGEKIVAVASLAKANVHTAPATQKEVRVPITDNLRVNFGYGDLYLKGVPELEGKTDVSMEEALKILQARHPEYALVKKMAWFKEQEFWFPDYPTSSKGVDVTDEDGRFLLPRVPNELLGEMLCTFAEYACKGLEYACAFIFDTRTESWRLSFPDQEISPVSVNCNFGEDCEIPYEFVAIQAHSHHKMTCSFSSVDNRDEIMEGPVFIVAHSYDEAGNAFELECRTRRNGEFVYLDAEDVFQY